ncbi:hypothetical protein SpAn4DRAFT_4159 [Sporomusa ovata]|uniref:Uncharacterized protein n=1 Tax=Sporomusa ovata TaxID=2378 RepID=A0A0U1L517_9FIRM|nr:hypothetical protein SpAn4DRAFT_4159 [Sporomusa ovata]
MFFHNNLSFIVSTVAIPSEPVESDYCQKMLKKIECSEC